MSHRAGISFIYPDALIHFSSICHLYSSIIPGNPEFLFEFPSSFILISCIAPGASFDGG